MPINKNDNELLKQIEELKNEIKKLKSRKKYGLVWEEKEEQVVLDCQNKLPILKEVKNKEIKTDKNKPVNILIEGDNYHSLSVLNYTHKGKIDVIYIDPPYNTGAKDWKYNNDFVDENDSYRHSKWISMMSSRLRIAKNILKKDGILICAIDENELNTLGLLLSELFPTKKITCVTVIHNPSGIQGKNFSYNNEFLYFVYNDSVKSINFEERNDEDADVRPFINGAKGNTGNYLRTSGPNCFYPILIKDNDVIGFGDVCDKDFHPGSSIIKRRDGVFEIYPIDSSDVERKWLFARDSVESVKNELSVQKSKNGKITIIRTKKRINYKTVWTDSKYNAKKYGTELIKNILSNDFSFPKSLYAVIEAIKASAHPNNAIILDFFAGSGTTGHAVLELNKNDDGDRRFILCTNNENKICEDVTYPRIEKVIKGYKDLKGNKIEGLGGNLKYYKTAFVDTEHIRKISDESKIKLSYQVGDMIAIRENILDEVEKNDWWQIFSDDHKTLAIYFKEDKSKLSKLVSKLNKENKKVILYIFSWGKNEYKNEFAEYKNIRVEDIPEPILEVYKEINKL